MLRITLFGAGLHCNYCIDILEKQGLYEIIGIIDSLKEIGEHVFGYPIIGKQENLTELIEEYNIQGGLITIGDNYSRKVVFDCIYGQKSDFNFINAIHPSCIIANKIHLGKGIVAMAGCIFNPNCSLGNFTFFATGAQIEHDSFIDDFASVSAGSITGGKVFIGKLSAITLGVVILDRIKIGVNSVVGSGSLVTRDIPDNVLAYGRPSKVIRFRKEGEKFLRSD